MMKRIFCLIVSLSTVSLLYGSDSEVKIIKLLFTSLFHEQNIKVFSHSKDKINIIDKAGFVSAQNCNNSDIIYSSVVLTQCKNKPFFTDNYTSFKKDSTAIGAFYWKKGRPNILFLKSRLEKFDLELPKKFHKYILDES